MNSQAYNVQRELRGGMAVSASYIGSHGSDLNYGGSNDGFVNINQHLSFIQYAYRSEHLAAAGDDRCSPSRIRRI